jgi:hypothetical protein
LVIGNVASSEVVAAVVDGVIGKCTIICNPDLDVLAKGSELIGLAVV